MRNLFKTLTISALAFVPAAAWAAVTFESYYESKTGYASCPVNSYYCRSDFPRVATDRPIVIRKVTCYMEKSAPLRIIIVGVATQPGGLTDRTYHLHIVEHATGNGTHYYDVNEDVNFLVRPNQYPFIDAETSVQANGSQECTLVGDVL